ncbi:MAG: hypothetical protein RMJ17_01015, partial [Candidatus Aenigmarchaeota archaeon]|nr:hypothetical protein [Candidatus Aenigmarchaeota archaeon]MDW8149166.1 hypothetical protein [Candidatus Aenigmarchaeota archaeon]
PLGEAAWNFGYVAGEYDAGKASGRQVALEGAKFSVQLGFYGFARGFRGRVVGLYIKQTSIPEGLKRYTRFIAEIERYYRELPHIIKNINNARKLGLDRGYDIELQNRIN